LSDAEGPVWHAASPDNWVRPELVEAGWVGLDWAAPDFSTLCRRQQTLNVSLPYRGSKGPLNLLIDSTGIKAEGEGAFSADYFACACQVISGTPVSIPLTHASMCCRAAGGPKRRLWRKIHIGIDEETLEVWAVEVTSSNIGPSRQIALQSPAGQWMLPCCQNF
jgi:hypothetical protein